MLSKCPFSSPRRDTIPEEHRAGLGLLHVPPLHIPCFRRPILCLCQPSPNVAEQIDATGGEHGIGQINNVFPQRELVLVQRIATHDVAIRSYIR